MPAPICFVLAEGLMDGEFSTDFTQFLGCFQHRHLGTGMAHCNGCCQASDPRTDNTDMDLRTLEIISIRT